MNYEEDKRIIFGYSLDVTRTPSQVVPEIVKAALDEMVECAAKQYGAEVDWSTLTIEPDGFDLTRADGDVALTLSLLRFEARSVQ